jgi:hypothetical protein
MNHNKNNKTNWNEMNYGNNSNNRGRGIDNYRNDIRPEPNARPSIRHQDPVIPPEVRQLPNGGFVQKPRKKKYGKDMPVCLDYLKGVCHMKRWKCKYAHPPLRLMAKGVRTETEGKKGRRVCEVWLLTGFCKFGESCRDYHPPLDDNEFCCAPAVFAKPNNNAETSSQCGSDDNYGSDTCSGSTSTVGKEHASVPLGMVDSPSRAAETASLDKVVKKVNGILNRLTPEKFDNLLQQFFELLQGDQAEACLQRVLPLLVSKAVSEPKLGNLYARLTKHLYSLVSQEEQAMLQSQLRQLSNRLLEVDDIVLAVRSSGDSEQFNKLQQKRLGNVKFVGELVNLEVLSVEHLSDYVDLLLKRCNDSDNDEASFHIELLTSLMVTCGQYLDKNADHFLSNVISRLHSTSGHHPQRCQMLVMNLLDLRNGQWVHKFEQRPRTLAEIEADFSPKRALVQQQQRVENKTRFAHNNRR